MLSVLDEIGKMLLQFFISSLFEMKINELFVNIKESCFLIRSDMYELNLDSLSWNFIASCLGLNLKCNGTTLL